MGFSISVSTVASSALLVASLVGVAATSSIFKAALAGCIAGIAAAALVWSGLGAALRIALVGVLSTFAAFGLLTPWIICRHPPYDGDLCPLDQQARRDLQRARIKWMLTLGLVTLGLFWWEVTDLAKVGKKVALSIVFVIFKV